MSLNQLIQTIESFPHDLQREVALFVAFLQTRGIQDSPLAYSAALDLPDYDQPLSVEAYALDESAFEPLEDMWADEADAETLCKLLTP